MSIDYLKPNANNTPLKQNSPRMQAIGPEGEVLTLDSLPPSNTVRWVTKRKAQVVAAVNSGLISAQDACDKYSISKEEFQSWQTSIKKFGYQGLQTTKLKKFRQIEQQAKNI